MEKFITIQADNFDKARKAIGENKNKQVIFSSSTDELNKKILEKENIHILLLNLSSRKDKMKQRDSGFNQVLAKLAKKKGVTIGINLDEIINPKPKEKSEILARVKQNVKLCNKNKLKMKFISSEKRNKYNLKSLGLVLGMPTWMTRDL